jgi:hypothetical protein
MITLDRSGPASVIPLERMKTMACADEIGRSGFAATGPVSQRFLRRFFQKAATSLFGPT